MKKIEVNQDQEIVIFRKFKDGDIIALFPGQAQYHVGHVGSYEHIGQHGTADYNQVISITKPATKRESASLKKELKEIGHDLIERKKGQYKYFWWFNRN